MNFVFQIILCVIYSIVGILVCVGSIYLIKEQRLVVKNLSKPATTAPKVPEYLDYEKTMKNLNTHLVTTFQRIYTSMVLPSLKDNHGRINLLAPNDKTYANAINIMVIQSYARMPPFLKKSVYKYFDVDETKTETLENLTEYITSYIKGKFDAHIISIAEQIEKLGSGSADIALNAIKSVDKTLSEIGENTKTAPDGSEVTID